MTDFKKVKAYLAPMEHNKEHREAHFAQLEKFDRGENRWFLKVTEFTEDIVDSSLLFLIARCFPDPGSNYTYTSGSHDHLVLGHSRSDKGEWLFIAFKRLCNALGIPYGWGNDEFGLYAYFSGGGIKNDAYVYFDDLDSPTLVSRLQHFSPDKKETGLATVVVSGLPPGDRSRNLPMSTNYIFIKLEYFLAYSELVYSQGHSRSKGIITALPQENLRISFSRQPRSFRFCPTSAELVAFLRMTDFADAQEAIVAVHEGEINADHTVGDSTCVYNARSQYIRCAVNPSGPCRDCSSYTTTEEVSLE